MQYYCASGLLTNTLQVSFCIFFVCGKILPTVLEAEAHISARLSFSHRH